MMFWLAECQSTVHQSTASTLICTGAYTMFAKTLVSTLTCTGAYTMFAKTPREYVDMYRCTYIVGKNP